MPGMRMQNAIRYMKRKLDDTVAVDVKIVAAPGNAVIDTIDAIPIQANFQDYVIEGFAQTAQQFDWIVQSDKLVFPGAGKLEPKQGWELRWRSTISGREHLVAVYVAQNDDRKRCFDVEDNLGLLFNIHTILDRVENAE